MSNGSTAWNATNYDEGYGFVHEYGSDLLDVLSPVESEYVLDLGCGTGHLTKKIAESGSVAVGIDRAPEMIRKAKESYPGVDFYRGDARTLPFRGAFDAVFSNAALHWIPDPDTVAAEISDALVPGGRFVAELGAHGNVSTIVEAAATVAAEYGYDVSNPWYFPTVGAYATVLETAGFEIRFARVFDRPTVLNGGRDGLREWLCMFGGELFAEVDDSAMEPILREIDERTRERLFDEERQCWIADYRRLRIRAVLSDD